MPFQKFAIWLMLDSIRQNNKLLTEIFVIIFSVAIVLMQPFAHFNMMIIGHCNISIIK